MSLNENENENEFSPESINQKPSEYNPFQSFLDSNDTNVSLGSSAENNNESVSSPAENTETHITTEEDIEIPDFLKSSNDTSNIEEFENGIKNSESSLNPVPSLSQNVSENDKQDSSQNNTTLENTELPFSPEHESLTSSEIKPEQNEPINNENQNFDTNEKEKDIKFESKISASEADKPPTSKPRVLNKKFLLAVMVVVLCGVLVITFLMPSKGEKASKKEKPVAQTNNATDYSAFASRPKEDPIAQHYETEGKYENTYDENGDVEIPPVVPVNNEKKPYTPETVSTTTGTGAGNSTSITIPDTRNDGLRSKSIAGIKGLTSTQSSYSTDYQQTIAKNTAAGSGNSMMSKEEFVNSQLSQYSGLLNQNGQSSNNSYAMQNDQSGKNSFFNNGRQGDNVGQGQYLNLNTLWQGSIFEAVLTSELNTDLPGEITARIAKNIYSSQDGRYLLIPQNSLLYGTYNSSISYSQSRVQVAWHTLVRPDGYQIQLGNMNATDAKGASGLKGLVNDHPLGYLKAIGLMSVFSIVNSEFEAAIGDSQNQYIQNIIANTQQVTNELADKLIDRAMNVQPTIKIKAGTKINIVVNQNLSLPPVEDIPVTETYKRLK